MLSYHHPTRRTTQLQQCNKLRCVIDKNFLSWDKPTIHMNCCYDNEREGLKLALNNNAFENTWIMCLYFLNSKELKITITKSRSSLFSKLDVVYDSLFQFLQLFAIIYIQTIVQIDKFNLRYEGRKFHFYSRCNITHNGDVIEKGINCKWIKLYLHKVFYNLLYITFLFGW